VTTTKLRIYNGALAIIGERALGSVSEQRKSRRELDLVWDDGGVDECLEAGQWYFAMRSTRITYDPSITPDWGYKRVFEVPEDHIRTCAVCQDEMLNTPLLSYREEAGFWYSELDTIYVRYVSNDATFGMDMSLWPGTFVEYVKGHFAARAALPITQDKGKVALADAYRSRALANAKSKGAMADPTTFPAEGAWTASRRGRSWSWPDRGNRGRLIG
jgi:hypothetical protein